jgi:hypothetical protein
VAREARFPAPCCAAFRDILGPLLFRPLPFIPTEVLNWDGGAVTRVATAAYHDRNWHSGHLSRANLLVLADALEEAGCDNAELLGHLRAPGVHVRGCWGLDLVLGKT